MTVDPLPGAMCMTWGSLIDVGRPIGSRGIPSSLAKNTNEKGVLVSDREPMFAWTDIVKVIRTCTISACYSTSKPEDSEPGDKSVRSFCG